MPTMRSAQQRDDLVAVGSLLDPVRRRLYDHVARSDEPVTRDAAAAAVGIGRPLAAFHLERLVSAGLLEPTLGPSGAPRGRGRPSKLYRRRTRAVEIALPARRYGVMGEIFARAIARRWATFRKGVLAAAREAGRDAGRPFVGRPRARRESDPYPRAARALAALGYEPKPASGRILLRNCPFEALSRQAPQQVCATNLAFLQGLCSAFSPSLVAAPAPEKPEGWCCAHIRSRS